MTLWINGRDAILAEVENVEHHIHNREIWLGSGATEDSLTAYQITSGNNTFGTEVLLLDTGDTPIRTGRTKFDFHRIVVTDVSASTPYILRIICGTGTVAAAETAKQYTHALVVPTGVGALVSGSPVEIMMPRLNAGTKVWAKTKNAVNSETISILIGLHEYII